MPAVMEAIDKMSPAERVKTMEYLWAAMTATGVPERMDSFSGLRANWKTDSDLW